MIIPQRGRGAQPQRSISRRNVEKVSGRQQKNAPPHAGRGGRRGENYLFFVSGVRCQILSLYSLMVRSEENTPLLATLMISLRVHAFWSR